MRILHTADWHLGHRLYDRDRTEEHRAALDWLLATIVAEQVELLIVAGDVFDVSNPSSQARALYYDFLARLLTTGCMAAVIVGGNHDSPAVLDAPAELLEALQLHVIGAARTQVQAQVVKIEGKTKSARPAVLVAAAPYLRERDLRKGSFGEDNAARTAALQQGIKAHYAALAEAAQALRQDPTTPIVATGHLFASGAEDVADKVSHIYQADTHNIAAGDFPPCFDYVALGHVHRAQQVGPSPRVRYAGSLIPLTFLEGQQARSVVLLELGAAGEAVTTRTLPVPLSRPLYRCHGPLAEVQQALQTLALATEADLPLRPWVEVKVSTDEPLPHLRQSLLDSMTEVSGKPEEALPLEIVRLSTVRLSPAPAAAPSLRRLDELRPEEVFAQLLNVRGVEPSQQSAWLADFQELRNWMREENNAS